MHARLQGRLAELLATHHVELDLQWTPGHQKKGVAAFLNNACDRLAGELRRELPSRRKRRRRRKKPPVAAAATAT